MRLAFSLFLAGSAFGAELRLVDAIKDQNRKAVMALIAAKSDVNAAQPDGSGFRQTADALRGIHLDRPPRRFSRHNPGFDA